jgi:hypothetical protein
MHRIRIQIRYRHRAFLKAFPVFLVLSVTLILGLGVRMTRAIAANPQSLTNTIFGVRQYYLTPTLFTGNTITNACAPGCHFASIWEIADPSGLKYTTLGLTSLDRGSGPPTAFDLFGISEAIGWVRTGYNASSTEPPGQANCNG